MLEKAYYSNMRDKASALTREVLDMVIIGQIMAFTSLDVVVGPSHKHSPTLRRRLRVKTFYHQGSKICRSTFLTLHGIGKTFGIITQLSMQFGPF